MDPAPLLALGDADRAAVAAALRRRDLAPRHRERLETVKAAALGFDLAAICAWSGRDPRTVRRWLAAFAAGGVAALADAPRPGRPPKAGPAYLAALGAAVGTPPRALGLGFDAWTSARLGAYLERRAGVRVAAGWLRVLLHRQRFACGRPKHALTHLPDPAGVAACREALRLAGGGGAG